MKSDLLILDEMAKANMDICACPDMVRADMNKRGGTIAMGVPEPAFSDFALHGKYIPILYLVNKEQFFALKEKE